MKSKIKVTKVNLTPAVVEAIDPSLMTPARLREKLAEIDAAAAAKYRAERGTKAHAGLLVRQDKDGKVVVNKKLLAESKAKRLSGACGMSVPVKTVKAKKGPKSISNLLPGGSETKAKKTAAPVAEVAASVVEAKPVKKEKAAKPVTTTTTAPKAKKDGLRKPQVRILVALSKAPAGLTRKQISLNAPCDLAFLTEYIGSHDDAIRAKNDAKQFMSLRTLGFVKVAQHDVDGKDVILHTLTASGKKAMEKAVQE